MCNRVRAAKRVALKTLFGNIVVIDEEAENQLDKCEEAEGLVSGYVEQKMAMMTADSPQRFTMMTWGISTKTVRRQP